MMKTEIEPFIFETKTLGGEERTTRAITPTKKKRQAEHSKQKREASKDKEDAQAEHSKREKKNQ